MGVSVGRQVIALNVADGMFETGDGQESDLRSPTKVGSTEGLSAYCVCLVLSA